MSTEGGKCPLPSGAIPHTHTSGLTLTTTVQSLCYLLQCLIYSAFQQHAPTPDDSPCPFTALPLCHLLQRSLVLLSNTSPSDLQLVRCPV